MAEDWVGSARGEEGETRVRSENVEGRKETECELLQKDRAARSGALSVEVRVL